jgi:hypothetical protein
VVAAGVGSLGRPSWFGRMIGSGRVPLVASRHGKALGHLEPADDLLYRLRPAPGSTLQATEPALDPARRGSAAGPDVAVQQPYQISTGDSVHDVRVEYE